MHVLWCEDFEGRVAIADTLHSLFLPGPAADGFGGSIHDYASSDAYTFVIAFPDATGKAIVESCALAIISVYELPMASRRVLGVEALAVRSAAFEDALEFLRVLTRMAKEAGLSCICLADAGVAKPGLLSGLARRGHLDDEPISVATPFVMRRESAGVWSAFADGPIRDGAFEAVPALCIVTEDPNVDVSGETYVGSEPLYRGEGRLSCAGWSCTTFEEVEAHVRKIGFAARADAPFAGTVQEQILHQGYVPQGTVSLSSSFEVCVEYATNRGTRPAGIVFTIDADRLRAHGPIWDAFATLARHCDWFSPTELDVLTAIVGALGIQAAGRFLARLHAGTRARAADVSLPTAPIDWDNYLDGGLSRLRAAGIDENLVAFLHQGLEIYWNRASGQIMAEDRILLDPARGEPIVEERPLSVFAYENAFLEVAPRLQVEALAPANPGWDLTAFGYIAKTCRDREYLSSGPVPPDCIQAATRVGAHDRECRSHQGLDE